MQSHAYCDGTTPPSGHVCGPFLRFGPDCSRAPMLQSMCAGIFVAGNRREAVKCQL